MQPNMHLCVCWVAVSFNLVRRWSGTQLRSQLKLQYYAELQMFPAHMCNARLIKLFLRYKLNLINFAFYLLRL